jgi:hypothetical protein
MTLSDFFGIALSFTAGDLHREACAFFSVVRLTRIKAGHGITWLNFRTPKMEAEMTKTDILNVMQRVKGASALDDDVLAEAAGVVRRVFPSAPVPTPLALEPVEEVLHLIDMALPGWSIQLTGKAMEPNGHWRCSLRETRGSDEIEVVGLGTGPAVALALLEALLDVAGQKDAART